MAYPMGTYSAGVNTNIWLRRFRFMLSFGPVGANATGGRDGRFPQGASIVYTASRPRLTFRDEVIQHQTEQIGYPVRSTWEAIDITFLHVAGDSSVYQWLKLVSNPENGYFSYYEDILVDAKLEMLNGGGDVCEEWILESCWPQSVDFGELDRATADIADVKVQLRYARAVLTKSESVSHENARS